jgi:hypothetical protein
MHTGDDAIAIFIPRTERFLCPKSSGPEGKKKAQTTSESTLFERKPKYHLNQERRTQGHILQQFQSNSRTDLMQGSFPQTQELPENTMRAFKSTS